MDPAGRSLVLKASFWLLEVDRHRRGFPEIKTLALECSSLAHEHEHGKQPESVRWEAQPFRWLHVASHSRLIYSGSLLFHPSGHRSGFLSYS